MQRMLLDQMLRARAALPFFVLLLICVPAAQAQITITPDDVRERLDEGLLALQGFGVFLFQDATAQDSAEFQNKAQAILDQIGPGGTYDFTAFDNFALFFGFISESLPLPVDPGVPGASTFNGSGADYATSSSTFGGTVYNYTGVESNGVFDYGSAEEGGETSVNDPPLLQFRLPLAPGTSWTTVRERETFGLTVTDSTYAEVIGYGQLITPGGSAPCLVYREQEFEIANNPFTGMPDTTLTSDFYNFYTKDLRLTAGIPVDASGAPEGVFYFVESGKSQSNDIASGVTGEVFNALGLLVELTQGSNTDGALQAFRIAFSAPNNTFSGSATSGDGTTVTPNVVSQDGYYIVEGPGLDGFEYRICLDYSGHSGVNDPDKLVILKRDDASEPWVPLNTSLDEGAQRVCASGLASFSQFAIGSNTQYNSLPVELAAFRAVQRGDAVELTWMTLAEHGSNRFEVQRAVGAHPESKIQNPKWVTVGAVDAVGTSTEAQRYHFTDEQVPFTAERVVYRLKQIDVDGSVTYSSTVEMALGMPEHFALHEPFPNPTAQQTTIRYELPEAAHVRLSVYDVLGRRVAVLADGRQEAGPYEVNLRTNGLAPGVYFLRLHTGSVTKMQRLVIVR